VLGVTTDSAESSFSYGTLRQRDVWVYAFGG
jgi:hypothetical protein